MRIPPLRRYLKDVRVRTDVVIIAIVMMIMMMLGTLAVAGYLITSIRGGDNKSSAVSTSTTTKEVEEWCPEGGVSTPTFCLMDTLRMEQENDEACTEPPIAFLASTFSAHRVFSFFRWLYPFPTMLYLMVGILVSILWKIDNRFFVLETLSRARVASNNDENEPFAEDAGGIMDTTTVEREGGLQLQQQQQGQRLQLEHHHRHQYLQRRGSVSLVDDCLSRSSLEDNLRVEKYSNHHLHDEPQPQEPTSTTALPSDINPPGMDHTSTETCCPICLLELEEGQWVTFCEPSGCNTIFHKECLFAWLQHSRTPLTPTTTTTTTTAAQRRDENNNPEAAAHCNTSCPCCRREMIAVIQPSDPTATDDTTLRRQPAWLSDLSTFMGYYVH